MLTDERIRELYQTATLDQTEVSRYRDFLASLKRQTDEELLSPDWQRKLWLARDVTGIGSGEIVDVDKASQDKELARKLVALRSKQWPEDPQERASAIGNEFSRILALVPLRESGRKPWAQLARAFAALLPADLHCAVNHRATTRVSKLLLPNPDEGNFVVQRVLARARLREVLGPEANLDEHVKRSTFCWWLADNYETVKAGRSAPLALWSFFKQRKGLAAPNGLSELYREVLLAAIGGATRSEIIKALGQARGHKESTRRLVVSVVISLGLLEERNNLLFPSQSGGELLDSEMPDALVEAILVRVFPFAHLLRKLSSGPKKAHELYEELQKLYPQWTTTQSPSQATYWAKHLRLIQSTSDGFELSSYGQSWEKRLPMLLPSPFPEEAGDDNGNNVSANYDPPVWPTLDEMRERFDNDEIAKTLVFVESEDPVASIHAAWHCLPEKRFIILSGLSGTGKTKVVTTYARLYCEYLGLDTDRHIKLVPVSPDWRDPSGLLGYLNALRDEPTFHIEPALRLLLDASADPSRPYFLILDEMNLARVERYFAPLLSAMETGGRIPLHSGEEEIDDVPSSLEWPTNLFIAGTVNMDETTYPFSDKVLDRAFTFEFWEVDLKSFFEKRAEGDEEERDAKVESVLLRLHDVLKPVRRHFGYRTAEEVLAFTKKAPEGQRESLFDQAIFSKILPRIRGENSDGLQRALAEAKAVCADHKLSRSAKKLAEMQDLLKETGLTKFWA